MKKSAKQEITLMQYIFLIHGAQVGIGITKFPLQLAEIAGTDGWMGIIIGWIVSLVASLVIIQVMKRHPDQNLIDLLQHYFGKWIGKVITLVIVMYMICLAYFVMQRMALHVKSWVLQPTPIYVLLILFAIPSYLIIRGGVQTIGRYAELVFFMSLWLLIVFLMPLGDSHWIHLLPLFKEGIQPVLLSASSSVLSFFGFEIAFFLYPYLQNKQRASIGIVFANSLTMLVYLYVTIVCFVYFSPDQITQLYEPTLSILKVIEFEFIERFDIILLTFYIIVVSKVWAPYLLFSVTSIVQVFGKKNYTPLLLMVFLIFVLVTYFLNLSFNDSERFVKYIEQVGILIALVFPLCFWFYMTIFDHLHRRMHK